MIYLIKHVFQNKTKDLNILVFNMITEKNGSKPLAIDKSCKCKCKI